MARRCSVLFQQSVGFIKAPGHFFSAAFLLQQSLGVPLATGYAEEVAAINMQGARQLWNGIAHGVDDVTPQRFRVFLSQRASSCGFYQTIASWHTPPEDIVFAAGVQSDDGPHLVIVRSRFIHGAQITFRIVRSSER